MGKKDPRIDAYIERSAAFAQPVLKRLRTLVHKACPEVEETMKWSFPHFDYRGEMMCSMAAFKEHCAFGFWKAALMKDPKLLQNAKSESAMGHLGRITVITDLPPDKTISAWIKDAMKLNEDGIKLAKPKSTAKKELEIPDYLTTALKKNKQALAVFNEFSYSNKKDYVEWIVDAKTDETRNKRLAQAIEWMAEGKVRNWKYLKK
jgi:uncharacterized protein YdeI (YjbR/CyaY-like superfamily)